MKHTDGEWVVDEDFLIMAGDTCIAEVVQTYFPEESQEANANLIAAAPGMYEALMGIMADLDTVIQPFVLERTIEALNKAEGK